MASAKEHYDKLLAGNYSWMFGGSENKITENKIYFESHGIKPERSGIAVDLGAGSGFQSMPLSQIGFSVIAIDFSEILLSEIRTNSKGQKIKTVNDDLLNFKKHVPAKVELCVCMGDTLTHLNSLEDLEKLFKDINAVLEDKGKLILSFRDLSFELTELDRIIPMRSDETKIFTCFLEYEQDKVKVHDILYEHTGEGWQLKKSFYRKLRISRDWIIAKLVSLDFYIEVSNVNKGMVEIIARK
ncbi:MAG: class I SAM-dependent methyltransferase [Ignavibacteriaceae bacterium]|jgi:SAM-dependent methyltransferase